MMTAKLTEAQRDVLATLSRTEIYDVSHKACVNALIRKGFAKSYRERGYPGLSYRITDAGRAALSAGGTEAQPQEGLTATADKLNELCTKRIEKLMNTKDGDEGAELDALVDAVQAYEAIRWPM